MYGIRELTASDTTHRHLGKILLTGVSGTLDDDVVQYIAAAYLSSFRPLAEDEQRPGFQRSMRDLASRIAFTKFAVSTRST